MLQTKVVQKVKTHFTFKNFNFSKKVPFMRKCGKILYSWTGHMIKRRMRISCWIPKTTNAQSEYVILIAFPRQHWSQERASMSRCAVCKLLVLLNLIVCLKITTEVKKRLWFCKVFMSSSKCSIIMEDKIMWLAHVFGIQIDIKHLIKVGWLLRNSFMPIALWPFKLLKCLIKLS